MDNVVVWPPALVLTPKAFDVFVQDPQKCGFAHDTRVHDVHRYVRQFAEECSYDFRKGEGFIPVKSPHKLSTEEIYGPRMTLSQSELNEASILAHDDILNMFSETQSFEYGASYEPVEAPFFGFQESDFLNYPALTSFKEYSRGNQSPKEHSLECIPENY